jgi:TPP-dependent pyruvate/acetoin dehydrogenase alpha subunit
MATKVKEPVAAEAAHTSIAAASNGSSNGGNPLISNEKLKQLYSTMLKCRLFEERARILKKQARFKGNYYTAVGQEATAVGAGIDLRPEDAVAPSHRDFILNLIKGVPLTAMFAQLYGRSTSPDKGRSAPAHGGYEPLNIITPASTIAAQLNIGTGIAMANQMKKNDNVVVAFSGEGSTSLGFWHEALNFAGVRNLPIVYVCQNNLWAESVSVKLQTKVEDISLKAIGYGFPGITVDGNDAVAMYRVSQEAIARARSGGGPTLIEAKTYRWYGHSEIDPAKYRAAEEVEEWKAKDPIAAMERYLIGKKLFSPEWKQEISEDFVKELDAAIEIAEKTPSPEPIECLDYLYSFDIRDRELNRKIYSPQF